MNQSIIFTDLQSWDSEAEQVVFPAQVMGANINCRVSVAHLSNFAGRKIECESQALAVFDEYRFDIEEKMEELIEREAFDENGEISW